MTPKEIDALSFNPFYNGIWFIILSVFSDKMRYQRFNPFYNGIWFIIISFHVFAYQYLLVFQSFL